MSFRPKVMSDVLIDSAEQKGDLSALIFLSQDLEIATSLTYVDLQAHASSIAGRIRTVCVPNDRVLLLFNHGPSFITAFFGCLYAGMIAVPVQPTREGRDAMRLEGIIRDTGAALGLTSLDLLPKVGPKPLAPSAGNITWLATDEMIVGSDGCSQSPHPTASSSVAYLQYTSGSTSHPRGVMISHSNLITNLAAINDDFHHTSESVGVTWLPHYHDMGLVYGLLQPIFGRYPCYVISPLSFARRPMRWLEAISRFGGTHSGGPNFAYDICGKRALATDIQTLDMSSWQVAFNGAEPVRSQTMAHFADTFKECGFRSAAFYPTYGLAEATLKVTGRFVSETSLFSRWHTNRTGGEPVSCGYPCAGTDVLIVNPDTRLPISGEQPGEIWVRGPGVAQGYWNKPEETKEVFCAQLADEKSDSDDTGARFLRTGDIGILSEHGLIISGRRKDIVIIRGSCYHPEDIEWTVHTLNIGAKQNCSAAFNVEIDEKERLVVMQEVGNRLPDSPEDIAVAVRSAIAVEHGISVYAIAFVVRIPKTTSGKVRRHACREMFGERSSLILYVSQDDCPGTPVGTIDQKVDPSLITEQLVVSIDEFVSNQLYLLIGIDKSHYKGNQSLASLGVDSLAALQVSHAIQSQYGSEIPLWVVMGSTQMGLADAIRASLHEGTNRSPIPAIIRREPGSVSETVSGEQERMWVLQASAPTSTAYNLTAAVTIEGPLDVDILGIALRIVEGRYHLLSDTFEQIDGTLYTRQACEERGGGRIGILDLRRAGSAYEVEARRYLTAEANYPFDLGAGPLMRFNVVCAQGDRYIVAITCHHIIADYWSLRLFLRTLFQTYAKLLVTGNVCDVASPSVQYRDYAASVVRYQNAREMEEHLAYWEKELHGSIPVLRLSSVRPAPDSRTYEAGEEVCQLEGATLQKVAVLATRKDTSQFVIMLAAFVVFLHKLSESYDIVVLSPFANRDYEECRDTFGPFAQPMLLRCGLSENPTFNEVVERVRKSVVGAIKHHKPSLVDIVKRAKCRQSPGHLVIAQAFFGLYPGVIDERTLGNLSFGRYDVPQTSTEFELGMHVLSDKENVTVKLRYATELFDTREAVSMLSEYVQIVGHAIENPEVHLQQLRALTERGARVGTIADEPMTVSVSATFTAEPLMEAMSFWAGELGWTLDVQFMPFDPTFASSKRLEREKEHKGRGVNVVLVRAEDWAGGSVEPERVACDFVSSLKYSIENTSADYIVCICPMSPRVALDPKGLAVVSRTETIIAEGLAAESHIHVVWGAEEAKRYAVDDYYDESSYRLGFVPYTAEFYAAVASKIMRVIMILRRTPSKAIICDCDNTLWSGVAAEDGIEGLYIAAGNRRLQEVLLAQKRSGVLLCLCSKNSEVDVVRAFESVPGLGLRWDDFVVKQINWNDKSENVRAIANALGIGLNNCVFIDDDPVECAEMEASCPDVTVIDLPRLERDIFIDHHWALDVARPTAEGSRRTELYQDNERRRKARGFKNFSAYLESLRLKVEICRICVNDLDRASELTYRTNQFNTTGVRMSAEQIRNHLSSGKLDGLTFRLTDVFGDYGIVGVVFFAEEGTSCLVEVMLLSCRALGRGVEYRMLAECGRIAIERGLSEVAIRFNPSSRNQPALRFLERAVGEGQAVHGGYQFRLAATVAAASMPGCDYGCAGTDGNKDIERDDESNARVGMFMPTSVQLTRIASSFRTGHSIVQAARGRRTEEIRLGSKPPTTPLETAVAAVWTELLGVTVSDIDMDFFDLGGDSLKAMRVISKVQAKCGVVLPLSLFFEGDVTIAKLCLALGAVTNP